MKNSISSLLFVTILVFANVSIGQDQTKVPVLDWSTQEGQERFQRAEKSDFFTLAPQFETQENKLYCAVASGTIILNALRPKQLKIEMKPEDQKTARVEFEQYLPVKDGERLNPRFRRYTQDTLFSGKASDVKGLEKVYGKDDQDYGLTLRQLHKILLTHEVSANLVAADESISNDQMREKLVEALKSDSELVIANFVLQESFVSKGVGHVSPVAAYDKDSDSFLVLDVHPYRGYWYWVESEKFITSMRTSDRDGNRGILIVSEKAE